MKPLRITAHRGASHDAPENTLAALRLGFVQGADAAECDVRLTRDGHVVLLHDASARRTSGVNASAALETLDTLRALDVGAWRGAEWAGEKIPTLPEALAAVPPGRRLLVEVKCGAEILPALARDLAATPLPPASLLFMSFDFSLAVELKRRFPAIETHWIVERENTPASALASRARAGGLDGLNLDRHFPLDAAFVSTLHEARLQVHVWTVDDPAAARRLAAAGVDSLTTNRPGWLRERLSERA